MKKTNTKKPVNKKRTTKPTIKSKKTIVKKHATHTLVFVIAFFFISTALAMINVNTKAQYEVINDSIVMPDKYNTGFKNNSNVLKISSLTNQTIRGVYFKVSGTNLVIDLFYNNQGLDPTTTIENVDFSAYPIAVYNMDKVKAEKTIIFKNCKFSNFGSGRDGDSSSVKFIFENSSFDHFDGSNASFDRSYFGGTTTDGLMLFQNVSVTNSYVSDIAHYSESIVHSDGLQILGYDRNGLTITANDISFSNVRMEIPYLITGGTAYVNAAIMLSLDDNDASNIHFDNMYINGGGYSIYLQPQDHTFTNISVKNIKMGYSHKYGILYKGETNGAVYENVNYANSLYIGSVWESDSKTHISVTNDTNIERKLKIVTSSGSTYEYTIPKTYLKNELVAGVTFDMFPIDLEKIINEKASWIKCYDITNSSDGVLIRTQVLDESYKNITVDQTTTSPVKNPTTENSTSNIGQIPDNSSASNGSSSSSSNTQSSNDQANDTSTDSSNSSVDAGDGGNIAIKILKDNYIITSTAGASVFVVIVRFLITRKRFI